MDMKMHRKWLIGQSWLRYIFSISALWSCKSHCSFKTMELSPQLTAEDAEMLETFKQMGPLLAQERYARPDAARENKKHKPNGAQPAEPEGDMMHLLKVMGQLLLRVDAEQQALKRQDSWICFMQTEPQALLPSLVLKAAEWKQQLTVKQENTDQNFTPLRCYLTQHMATTLNQRVTRLAKCSNEDPLKKVALDQGVLTPEGNFLFQRWSTQAQGLQTTSQTPISLTRMVKYTEQLMDILKDPCATVRFHSLRPMSTEAVVLWMWQISMRSDDLQVLLTTLQGCTVWALLGLSMKPHALYQSKQGQHLQALLGKGQGKQPGKGRGKHHHKTVSKQK